jgi:hypothetical protein
MPKQIRHIAQVCSLNADRIECSTGQVELVAQADVDIRDLLFLCLAARPLREGLEELLGGDEEVCYALLDLGDLLVRLLCQLSVNIAHSLE